MSATAVAAETSDLHAHQGAGRVARSLGRWRVALRYARRDATRHTGRTELVLALVGLPVLGAVATATVQSSWTAPDTALARLALGPEASALVTLTTAGAVDEQDLSGLRGSITDAEHPALSLDAFEDALAAALPTGSELVRSFRSTVTLAPGTTAPADVGSAVGPLVQTDLHVPAVAAAFPLREGAYPTTVDQVALDASVADNLGLGVGSSVTVTGTTTTGEAPDVERTVTGLVDVSGGLRLTDLVVAAVTVAPDPTALPAVVDEDALLALPGEVVWYVVGGPVNWAHVRAANLLGTTVTSQAVLADPPVDPEGLLDLPEAAPASRAIVAGILTLGVLQAALMIGPAFAVGARRNARDLALLGAQGADRRVLRTVQLAQGFLLGLLASTVASVLAVGLVDVAGRTGALPLPATAVPWGTVAVAIAAGTALTVAAAWPSARTASRNDPAQVLGNRRPPLVQTPRRSPVIAVVLVVAGVLTALVAGRTQSGPALVLGAVVAEAGVVVALPAVVALLGRTAPGRRLPVRFVLRDSARHASRTVPAVAAVLVAVAGATAAATVIDASQRERALLYLPSAAVGTVTVVTDALPQDSAEIPGSRPARALAASTGTEPLAVEHLSDGDPDHEVTAWMTPVSDRTTVLTDSWTGALVTATSVGTVENSVAVPPPGILVTDGTQGSGDLLDLLGTPHRDVALAALQSGKAVVPAGYVSADGTARMVLQTAPRGSTDLTESDVVDVEVVLPAVEVDVPLGSSWTFPILPPALVADLGMTTQVRTLVSSSPTTMTTHELLALAAAAGPTEDEPAAGAPTVTVAQETGPPHPGSRESFQVLLAAAGVLVAVAAAAIATALAVREARPDLATLASVGAGRGVRRQISATYAATVTWTGVALGLPTGLGLGAALVGYQRFAAPVPAAWTVAVPWTAVLVLGVALPLLTVGGSALLTRRSLPLARRLDA